MGTVLSMLGAVTLLLVGVAAALAIVILVLHEIRYIIRLGQRLRGGARRPQQGHSGGD